MLVANCIIVYLDIGAKLDRLSAKLTLNTDIKLISGLRLCWVSQWIKTCLANCHRTLTKRRCKKLVVREAQRTRLGHTKTEQPQAEKFKCAILRQDIQRIKPWRDFRACSGTTLNRISVDIRGIRVKVRRLAGKEVGLVECFTTQTSVPAKRSRCLADLIVGSSIFRLTVRINHRNMPSRIWAKSTCKLTAHIA